MISRVKFENKCRKLATKPTTIVELKEAIGSLYGEEAKTLHIVYKDCDKELINVVDDDDIENCFLEAEALDQARVTFILKKNLPANRRAASKSSASSSSSSSDDEMTLNQDGSEKTPEEKQAMAQEIIASEVECVKARLVAEHQAKLKKIEKQKETKLKKWADKQAEKAKKVAKKIEKEAKKAEKKIEKAAEKAAKKAEQQKMNEETIVVSEKMDEEHIEQPKESEKPKPKPKIAPLIRLVRSALRFKFFAQASNKDKTPNPIPVIVGLGEEIVKSCPDLKTNPKLLHAVLADMKGSISETVKASYEKVTKANPELLNETNNYQKRWEHFQKKNDVYTDIVKTQENKPNAAPKESSVEKRAEKAISDAEKAIRAKVRFLVAQFSDMKRPEIRRIVVQNPEKTSEELAEVIKTTKKPKSS